MPLLPHWLTPLALLLVVVLSAASTAMVIRVVVRLGFVALPRADRWHTRATALHGGVGFAPVVLFVSAAIVIFAAVQLHAGSLAALRTTGLLEPAAVLLGGAAMFALGLVDDFLRLKPSTKLAGQIAAAAPLLVAVGPFELTSWLPLDLLITYLWIIGITNAVNLLDNMDGVSAGVCAISFAAISATLAVQTGDSLPAAGWMSAILSAATVGFWVHNRPPAKVFMGDSGSLFLGFMLATLTMPSELNRHWSTLDSQPLSSLQQGLVAIAFAGTPILDTVLVTVTRLWRNQSPAVGGKDHSTHRLARLGLDGWQTLAIVLSLAAASGLAGFSMVLSPSTIYPLFGLYLVGLLLVGVWLSRVPVAVSQASGAVQDFIRRRQTPLVQVAKAAVDVLVVATCYYGAYLLRFDFSIDDPTREAVVQSLPIVLACCLVAHLAFRSYTRSWRAGAPSEMVDHALPAIVGAAASVAVVVVSFGLPQGYSRGAFAIFGVLLVVATLLSRFSFVMLDELSARLRARTSEARNVVIYGAGRAGRLLASEAPFVPGGPVRIVGFIDDDPSKHGFRISGIRVSGPDWWTHPRRHRPTEVWVSSPMVPKVRIERLVASIGPELTVRWLDVRISGLSADSGQTGPTEAPTSQDS